MSTNGNGPDKDRRKSLEEQAAEDRRLEKQIHEGRIGHNPETWYPVVVDGKGRMCSRCGGEKIVQRWVGPLWQVRCNGCLNVTEVYEDAVSTYVPPAEAPCFPVELPDLRAELVANWASGAYQIDVDPADDKVIKRGAAQTLSEANLYWVGPDMCELLYGSAPNVPDEVMPEDLSLPSQSGFVLFSRTWVTEMLVDAIAWHSAERDRPEEPRGALIIEPYRKILGSKTWRPSTPIVWFHGHRLGGGGPWDRDPDRFEMQNRQLISAFVTLLQSPTMTTETEEPMPRHVIRRAEREGRALPKVRLIYLRKPPSHPSDEPMEPTTVNWSHRWVSSAHYRRQRYGPRDGPYYYRLISIPASIKGPAHLPIVVRPTVRAWVR